MLKPRFSYEDTHGVPTCPCPSSPTSDSYPSMTVGSNRNTQTNQASLEYDISLSTNWNRTGQRFQTYSLSKLSYSVHSTSMRNPQKESAEQHLSTKNSSKKLRSGESYLRSR